MNKSHKTYNLKSTLNVQEKYSEPDHQGWSYCENCGMRNNTLFYFDNSLLVNGPFSVDLSWSHWGEFFHENNNDQIRAYLWTEVEFPARLWMKRPVYMLPMITLHVGHILVDLLEQVYFNMMATYGRVRRDALLVVDVASSDERAVLQAKLDSMDEESAGFAVRAALTDLPLLSMNSCREQMGLVVEGVLFAHLHVGLDTSRSHFQVGYRHHPCLLSTDSGNREVYELASRYRQFSAHINASVRSHFFASAQPRSDSGGHASDGALIAAFIQRSHDRVLLNLDKVFAECATLHLNCSLHRLEAMSFAAQLELFGAADVLVAAAGTALHNMMFMRPGSAVVLVMQPNWCPWAWMYANQAVLLGITPHVYCDSSEDDYSDRRFHQWSRRFWRQGPRMSKNSNTTLEVSQMTKLLFAARGAVTAKSSESPVVPRSPVCFGVPTDTQRESKVSPKVVEMFVSAVTVQSTQGDDGASWQVGVVGEVGLLRAGSEGAMVAHSLPHLSVCLLAVLLSSESEEGADEPWCFPVRGLNYFSAIHLHLGHPVFALRFWAQISPEGGKLRGSDTFVVVDCRLENGGFEQGDVQRPAHLALRVGEDCRVNDRRTTQIVSIGAQTKTAPCSVSRLVSFSDLSTSRRSVQRRATSFCLSGALLTDRSCGLFLAELQRRKLLSRLAAKHSLPAVQLMPSPSSPFVFLHIEKTGGTTLRE